jgi:transposase
LKGHSLSLTPLYLKYEQRIVGLIFLLSIALRVLVLMQFVARENPKREGTTLKGLYPRTARQTNHASNDGDDAARVSRDHIVADYRQRRNV